MHEIALGYATHPQTEPHAGVVYGWDKECERDPDWAAAVQADPNQPFYHVLPDEGELTLPVTAPPPGSCELDAAKFPFNTESCGCS